MPSPSAARGAIRVAVLGAHLSGQPLNHQLTDLGARFEGEAKTAPRYRFYALSTVPPKPGLVRCGPHEAGAAIALEIWRLCAAAFGRFVDSIPAPLCMGRIELESGENVAGFLCEPHATVGAREITRFGGWKAFLLEP